MNIPPESWIQDAIYEHPLSFVWAVLKQHSRQRMDWENAPEYVDRWREFQTSAGRIDLLFAWEGALLVVEVKREVIDESAIAQCLRYVGALKTDYDLSSARVIAACTAPQSNKDARYAAAGAGVILVHTQHSFAIQDVEMPRPSARENAPGSAALTRAIKPSIPRPDLGMRSVAAILAERNARKNCVIEPDAVR